MQKIECKFEGREAGAKQRQSVIELQGTSYSSELGDRLETDPRFVKGPRKVRDRFQEIVGPGKAYGKVWL